MPRIARLLGALALAVLTSWVPPLAGAPAAHASSTICVALVVDFSTLGGGVHSGCVTVPQGSTGYDVLHAGGHSFTICSNGVLGTIDGQPANGCRVKDNTHYWAYWHRAPHSSTWTYSDEGGGTYEPANASTEGWVWQNGSSRQPANVPYDDICKPAPSPTPTGHSSTAPRPPSRSTPHPTTSQQVGAAGVSSPVATLGATPHRSASRPPTSTPTPTAAAASPTGTAATTPAATTGHGPVSHDSSRFSPGEALGAAAGIAALGVAAAVRNRRER